MAGGQSVLVGEDTVLTAGHVLLPPGAAAPDIGDILVELPWLDYLQPRLAGFQIHQDWLASQTAFTSDVALIRVDPVSEAGLRTTSFLSSREVSLYGFPLEADDGVKSSFQSGHLRRQAGAFFSRSFDIREGMSGGPFLQVVDGETRAIGIATSDSEDPAQDAFNGIPLDSSSVRDIWPGK